MLSAIMLAVGLAYMAFYVAVCFCCTQFVEVLIMEKNVAFFQMFSIHMLMIALVLYFTLLIWCIILIDSYVLNHPCVLGKSHLVLMYNPFNVLVNSVCLYFVENFCIFIHHKYWPMVFFSVVSWSDFWYQVNVGHVKWL